MAENINIIADYLRSDADLLGSLDGDHYIGYAQGGIWTRRLQRDGDFGLTPEAFYVSDKGRMIRPSIVVLDRGDVPHRQRQAIPSSYIQTVHVYYYAPATESGKAAIVNMRRRVYELIDHEASGGWVFASEDGPVVFVNLITRFGRRDSETYPEAVEDYQQYALTSRYADIG